MDSRRINIVGLNKSDLGRTCSDNEPCGEFLSDGDKVIFREVQFRGRKKHSILFRVWY